MQTINLKLIVRHQHGTKWESAGEHALPALPQIGEAIALVRHDDNEIPMYRVVTVVHSVPFQGLTEVFAVYDGSLSEVQDRLFSS